MNAPSFPTPVPDDARAQLASELSQPSDSISRRLGMIGGGALAFVFLIGAFVPIDSGTLAPGHIMIENKRKTVQHLDGGIIRWIHVKDGNSVKAGDLLITLDDTVPRLNLSVYQVQSDSLRAEQAALQAEVLGHSEIAFPPDLLARTNEPDVANILAAQRAAFAARRENVAGRKALLGQQVSQIDQEISGDHAGEVARNEQLALLNGEISDMEMLFAKGFATKTRILALKRAASQIRGERAGLGAEGARLRTKQGEINIQRLQVEREAVADAANALRTIEGQLAEVQDKLSAARQALARTQIRAPVSGTIVGLRPTTVGGVIQPGETLMDVVPQNHRLVVTARISPKDAATLHRGQNASVRFDGNGAKYAPVIGGTLQNFSADSLTDSKTGETYFEAEVAVPDSEARKLPQELLKPGVPAEVLIKTGERTALGYMLAPITRLQFHALRER